MEADAPEQTLVEKLRRAPGPRMISSIEYAITNADLVEVAALEHERKRLIQQLHAFGERLR